MNTFLPFARVLIILVFLMGGSLYRMPPAVAQTDGFTANFSNYGNGAAYGRNECAADMGNCVYWLSEANSEVNDGNLRVRFQGKQFGPAGAIGAAVQVNRDRVYTLEYKVRFDKDFEWKLGGKLPGLAGGDRPTGGDDTSGGNGFSTRYMWRKDGRMVVYAYYEGKPADKKFGEDWECEINFVPERWYTLRQKVTVNTGNQANGKVEVWVDGSKKLTKTGLLLMSNGSNGVDFVLFDTFMGGADSTWAPSGNQYLRMDNFKCVKGGDPTPPQPPTTQEQAPYDNDQSRWPIADEAVIQAEDYDLGGQGISYQDETPNSNSGKVYRNEGVDIGKDAAGRNYVGWILPGEWIEYSVDATAGTYDILARMASPVDDRTLRLTLDGNVLGTIDCPNASTGYGDFRTATLTNVTVPAGEHILRLEMVDGAFNLDDLTFLTAGTGLPRGNVTVRAQGTSGTEQLEIRYNDEVVGEPITLSTTFQEYKVLVDNPTGNFKVAFVNDDTDRNALVDWLRVEGAKRQAESRRINTGAWGEGVCGGGTQTERLSCNGYIDFGSFGNGDGGNLGRIVVRASGTCGAEGMELWVDGQEVEAWENVATGFKEYTYNEFSGSGEISVHFTTNNEIVAGCDDQNLEVDWIEVCGTRYQTETVATETADCCLEDSPEKLFTNGNFNYGTLSCNSAARPGSPVSTGGAMSPPSRGGNASEIQVYPNPTRGGVVNVRWQGVPEQVAQVVVSDLQGQVLYQGKHTNGQTLSLPSYRFPEGVYLLRVENQQRTQTFRMVINP